MVVVALALLVFLVMEATAVAMPLEQVKTEPTQPVTELEVALAAETVLVEMGRKVICDLSTGAQTKC